LGTVHLPHSLSTRCRCCTRGEDAVDALAELSQSAGGHGLVVSNDGGLAGIIDERPRSLT
jgi:hypothetical protein